MVSIQIRLLPDEAARLMRAIELGADRGSLADGAVALAETMLSGSSGADVAAGGASAIRPPVEVAVHISAANLEGTTEVGDGLSAETCRRLLCDAGVVPMLEDDSGKTIDVGRKTRSVPPALRRALNARDRTCRFPGCMHRRMLDAHHVRHWIDGGETKLSNLLNCCRRHHRYLHEYAFSAELRDGELVFLDPDGTRSRRWSCARRSRTAPSIGYAPRSSNAGSRSPRRRTLRAGTASRSTTTPASTRSAAGTRCSAAGADYPAGRAARSARSSASRASVRQSRLRGEAIDQVERFGGGLAGSKCGGDFGAGFSNSGGRVSSSGSSSRYCFDGRWGAGAAGARPALRSASFMEPAMQERSTRQG
jgi:hypothetical protein